MSSLLAPDYREEPLWHEGVVAGPSPHPPPGELPPSTCDVVVVGAGYCGASAAAGLAARGREVVVVDAEDAGARASTRNGGMVIPELKFGPETLGRRHGHEGERLVQHTLDAYAHLRELVVDERIDCDWRDAGGLLLAHHPRRVRDLRDATDEWGARGEPVAFLDRDELASEIGSDVYAGGFLMRRTAGIQPAKLHAALTARATRAGARIHHRTRVTRIEQHTDGFRMQTTRGSIRAGDVLVAANAYVDGALPDLQRRVLPIGSFVIATEPLGDDLGRAVLPGNRMCFDTKHLLNYWRLSPDGRMVFGGRASLSRTSVAQARETLYAQMVDIHPQLRGVRLTHAWGGDVAVTRDRLPHCGRIDGVAYATGCNGTGVALATWFGTRAAAWMTGEEDPPAFAGLTFRPIPLRSLRRWWLPPAGRVLQFADRYGV
jgi:glycine/D-amino acid oxidase-like deaminating enzyme